MWHPTLFDLQRSSGNLSKSVIFFPTMSSEAGHKDEMFPLNCFFGQKSVGTVLDLSSFNHEQE